MTDNRGTDSEYRRILGINFFGGSASHAIAIIRRGGLLVVPAAPALKDLDWDMSYREALLGSADGLKVFQSMARALAAV